MECTYWQGIDMRGMIGRLAVNCALIFDCCNDDREPPAETTSDEMVIGAVWAL